MATRFFEKFRYMKDIFQMKCFYKTLSASLVYLILKYAFHASPVFNRINWVYISLGNPSKNRQQFVDAIVLISAPDWSKQLSKMPFKSHPSSLFERRTMLGFTGLIWSSVLLL